jgi:hypothetical protein
MWLTGAVAVVPVAVVVIVVIAVAVIVTRICIYSSSFFLNFGIDDAFK